MWTIIVSVIVILAGLFGIGFYMLLNWSEKMDHNNAFDPNWPVLFNEEKPCGAITGNSHPCDYTKHYTCRNCELGI